jgi:glucose-fructose oxidoreductase
MSETVPKVRFAVVGLGHFAQAAVLPAFASLKNAELVALFSGDAEKRIELGERYEVEHSLGYDDLDTFLSRGIVDAVYVAVPNNLHKDFTLRAARAGVHVLCEKPMAIDTAECEEMIEACRAKDLKLMIAYRLHFEPSNLEVIELVRSGHIGNPRLFNSVFGMQVRGDNVRTEGELGGGPLYDIGVYCINAARTVFGAEPLEVTALEGKSDDPRFSEVEEQLVAALRFPGGRLATFAVGFSSEHVARYEVFGTGGSIRVDPAFSYDGAIAYEVTEKGRTEKKTHGKRDQIAGEIQYFANCVLNDLQPEPSGLEGLCDVRVIEALFRSAREGRSIELAPFERDRGPELSQVRGLRAHSEPELVNVQAPRQGK